MDRPQRAVLFLDDSFDSADSKPLMLEDLLFCPILEWVGDKLQADGVKRFFLVCAPAWAEAARACFPAEADVTVCADHAPLLDWLRGGGSVAVFPCQALPLPLEGGFHPAYVAAAEDLAKSWAGGGSDGVPGADELEAYTAFYDLAGLRQVELACRDAIVRRHMENGVRFLDPSAVYIDPRVRIGRGTFVLPGTILRGRTQIGENCTIGPHAMVTGCTIGSDTEINASQVNESSVGSGTRVGPFAYVRPGCTIGNGIKVGDFVEVKNSVIGDGTKISHLTYVGDSDVGERVNFGCGTVTTNYDGFRKYRCTIEDDAFIGCNTNLVAPVKVGRGSYVAAGATITHDVPEDALAVARARQENKEGWAARRRRAQGKG